MAKKFWWQKVSDPDSLVRAATAPVHDTRIQRATAIRYAGAFPDEPEIAQALANANLPSALALRAFHGYQSTKAKQVKDIAAAAGYGEKSLTENLRKADEVQAAVQKAPHEEASWWERLRAQAMIATGNTVLKVGEFAKDVGEGLMEGLNYIASPLTATAQAGYAAETDLERMTRLATGDKIQAGPGYAIFSGISNTLEGAARITGLTGMDAGQAADMRRAGYDPDSATSRYAYYFQTLGNKRAPVSEGAVQKLKADERWTPEDVDAAREIVSSGALNDLARSADSLSAPARQLLSRAGKDKAAETLLQAMADHSQLTFGGNLVSVARPDAQAGEWMGQGSVSRTVAGAMADLVGYWYADPLVALGSGSRVIRGADAAAPTNPITRRWAYGVNAESIDDVVTAIRATDADFKPVGAVASRFDQAMEKADRIVRLQQSGKVEDAAAAGKEYAEWIKLYPSMRPAFDTLIGMRTGAIGKLTLREGKEATKEASRAVDSGRNVAAWVVDAPADTKPLWTLTDDSGAALDAEARALQRAKVADEMAAFVLLEAHASGRELTNGRLLLPGQMSLNGALRNILGKFGADMLMRRDKSVMAQLKDSKGYIDFNAGVGTDLTGRWDQLLDMRPAAVDDPAKAPHGLNWISHNYTFGLTHFFARGWRLFERTFSNKTINPLDPNSVKVYGQLVSQFAPKRQAQMLTVQYAGANPGERYAMLRNTVGSFLNVMNLRNTPEAQELVEQLTKGLIPTDRAINGYKAGGHEHYTTPSANTIKIGSFELAAAVHPWQLNEGLELPSWREVRALVDRGKALNYTLGTVGPWGNALNQAWKATKTASWANAARQGIEGVAFTAVRNPETLTEVRKARAAVKADLVQRKVNDNDLSRLANSVTNFNATDLDALEAARKSSPGEYVSTMRKLLTSNGYEPKQADVLVRLSLDVDVTQLKMFASDNTLGVARLAMAGPIDFVRRIRAERAKRRGGEVTDSPLSKYLDEETAVAFTENAFKQLGAAADNYVTSAERIDREARQAVFSGAGKGFTMRPVKLRDAYQWLGEKAKINQDMWHIELSKRVEDPLDNMVLTYIAREALGRDPDVPAGTFATADSLAMHLLSEHELGATMRNNSARMQYLPNGFLAETKAERLMAAEATAQTVVDDLAHHLGGVVSRDPSGVMAISFAPDSRPLLEAIADGKMPTPGLLAKLPHEVYPEGLVHTLQAPIPGGTGSMAQKLANVSSKAYGAIVAKPLAHMVLQPLFVAERRLAYDHVEPLMDALISRGYSQGQAAFALEAMATNRAISRTFLSTDNPAERSVFSELGDKYLMFQRAQEDFVRRLIGATKANPGALARANLMMTSAVHAGALHYEPMQDEQGNTDYHLTFTYPGTAFAQRVLMDGMVAMGLAPEETLRIPQFDGMKSQVRFINPGVANPIQFSANPVFGWAIDGMEKIWPAQRIELERLKRGMAGGEDFGGGQSTLQQLMPSMFQRFVPLMQRDDADGQFASAFRTATIYAEAAGALPGPDASPEEKAKAMDAVKATATNILMMRAFTGTFLPASPQNNDPDVEEMDVLGRLQQLPNIRAEWFQIKSELSKKYPDNYSRAFSEAMVEFTRRYPGELLVNPGAFSVGTVEVLGTGDQGETVGGVPYTLDGTRWMLENLDFVKNNPTIALALMPRNTEGGDFNTEAYKLQLRSELRKHKDLEAFYRDVTLSDDVSEYKQVTQAYSEAAKQNPAMARGIYSKMETWQDGWRRTHPLASAELDRRAEPNFVHAEMAPALERLATGQAKLPANLEPHRAAITEMYQDWAGYRDRYLKVDFFNNGERSSLNKGYRETGKQKWLGTPLESLWKLMDVYEVS